MYIKTLNFYTVCILLLLCIYYTSYIFKILYIHHQCSIRSAKCSYQILIRFVIHYIGFIFYLKLLVKCIKKIINSFVYIMIKCITSSWNYTSTLYYIIDRYLIKTKTWISNFFLQYRNLINSHNTFWNIILMLKIINNNFVLKQTLNIRKY